MQIPSFEPTAAEPPTEVTTRPPDIPWLEKWGQGLEVNRSIAKAMLLAGGGGSVLQALPQLIGLMLERPAKTLEDYAYGIAPAPTSGFGRLNQLLAPENVELAAAVPLPPGAKTAALVGAGAKAIPFIGKAVAPLMAGITKGVEPLVSALTKVEPVQDLFAALKGLAHQHVMEPALTEGHPAIAHLPIQDQQSVIDWHKLFRSKYGIWGGPEGHAEHLAKGNSPPSGYSFDEYPPGWADTVQAKFDELTGQGPAANLSAGASPIVQPSAPMAGWEVKEGKIQPPVGAPSLSANALQEGWQHQPGSSNILAQDAPALYAEHDTTGAKLSKVGAGHWKLELPNSITVNFTDASDAKHYFALANQAGLVEQKAGQFTAAELKPVPIGTTGVPSPADEWTTVAAHPHMKGHPSGAWIWENPDKPGEFQSYGAGANFLGESKSLEDAKALVAQNLAGAVQPPLKTVLGWSEDADGFLKPPGPTKAGIHVGWELGAPNPTVGQTYSMHDSGAKIVMTDNGWGLHDPDGNILGAFSNISNAKHYFKEAKDAGAITPKPAAAPGLAPTSHWGYDVPHPDIWTETGTTQSGSLIFENTYTGVGIVQDPKTGLLHYTTQSGDMAGSGYSTPKKAGEAYDSIFGGQAGYPSNLQPSAPPSIGAIPGWTNTAGFWETSSVPPAHVSTAHFQKGWLNTGLQSGNGLYSDHIGGATIHKSGNGYELVLPDGTNVYHFDTAWKAKQYFQDAEAAGVLPKAAPATWTETAGSNGTHFWHPSGLTVEQSPSGNFQVLDSQGIMVDYAPTAKEAQDLADAYHVPSTGWQPPAFTPSLSSSPLSGAHSSPVAPTSIDNWTQTGPQMGSNEGGKYVDPDGNTYYVKYPQDTDMTRNEMLGLMLYKAMGIHTPEVQLVTRNGHLGIASHWVEGIQTSGHADELAAAAGAKEGFAADAWMANWDVVGMQRDNMLLDAGKALRADAGGSLLYRGLQGPKGSRFGDTVEELDTLRNGRNRFTSPVFKDMTDADVKASAQKVADLHPDQIRMLVEQHGPGDDAVKSALADKLIARRQDVLRRTGLKDPHGGSLQAADELEHTYQITPDELKMVISREPTLTAEEFLKRYKEAEQYYVQHLGLTPEQYRDPAFREKAAGALPLNLARGSERLTAAPEAPMTMAESMRQRYSNSTGWPSPWNFASQWDPVAGTGSTYWQSSSHTLDQLRALVPEDRIFRPDRLQGNSNSPEAHAFEMAYDYLKKEEAKGRPFPKDYHPDPKAGTGTIFTSTGKDVVKQWTDLGHGAGYSHVEKPDVALVLEQLGYKAFTTYERGGINYGFHHTVPLRWYKAPMDPRKKAMQGYFYGGAGAGGSGLAAYLAAQALQGRGEEQ